MTVLIHVNEYQKFLQRFYHIDKPVEYYIENMNQYIAWCKLLDEQRKKETEQSRVLSVMIADYMHKRGWSTRDIDYLVNDDFFSHFPQEDEDDDLPF